MNEISGCVKYEHKKKDKPFKKKSLSSSLSSSLSGETNARPKFVRVSK